MRKIRVLQITHDLGVGGLPRVVVTLSKALDRSRFDVSVLCLNDTGPLADELTDAGIPVLQLDRPSSGPDYLAFLKVARVLKEQRTDLIHTHNTQPLIDGGLASLFVRRAALLHTDHARSFPDKRRYMIAEYLLSHRAYRMVGVSEHTSRNLHQYEWIPPHRIVTVQNGIDGSRFLTYVDEAGKRAELGLPASGPVIGLAARLTEQKGITYLLQALPALVARFPDLSVVIAGYGPLEDAHKAEAQRLGVATHVRFVGTRLDVPELLQVFDVFALPSIWEGLPMSVLEAMASGCVVVGSDVGGVGAALTNGVNSLLVPPAEPEALATALTTVLSDETLRARLAMRARQDFQARFSAEAMARRYEALYEKAIETRRQFGERV